MNRRRFLQALGAATMMPAARAAAQPWPPRATVLYDDRAVRLDRVRRDARNPSALWVRTSRSAAHQRLRAEAARGVPRRPLHPDSQDDDQRGLLRPHRVCGEEPARRPSPMPAARVWSFGEMPVLRGAYLESRIAPDFAVPDRKGRTGAAVRVSRQKGAGGHLGLLVRVPARSARLADPLQRAEGSELRDCRGRAGHRRRSRGRKVVRRRQGDVHDAHRREPRGELRISIRQRADGRVDRRNRPRRPPRRTRMDDEPHEHVRWQGAGDRRRAVRRRAARLGRQRQPQRLRALGRRVRPPRQAAFAERDGSRGQLQARASGSNRQATRSARTATSSARSSSTRTTGTIIARTGASRRRRPGSSGSRSSRSSRRRTTRSWRSSRRHQAAAGEMTRRGAPRDRSPPGRSLPAPVHRIRNQEEAHAELGKGGFALRLDALIERAGNRGCCRRQTPSSRAARPLLRCVRWRRFEARVFV